MVHRTEQILKDISKSDFGIEIAPWHASLAPKRDGYNVLILDVFDTQTLKERASKDSSLPENAIIEDVDVVDSATNIGDAIQMLGIEGQLDYVLGSHVFEHLPNPIKFLQGCAQGLKPGGIVTLVVPDHRACYDFFRVPTRLSEWVSAFHNNLDRPTPAQIFDAAERDAKTKGNEYIDGGFESITLQPYQDIARRYREWTEQERTQSQEYIDAHCWVFTPSSIELLLRDAAYLNLIPFQVSEIVSTGFEIIVRLILQPELDARQPEDYLSKTRLRILSSIRNEEAHASIAYEQMAKAIENMSQERSSLGSAVNDIDRRSNYCIDMAIAELRIELEHDRLLRKDIYAALDSKDDKILELETQLADIRSYLAVKEKQLSDMQGSLTWKAGLIVQSPVRFVRWSKRLRSRLMDITKNR